MKIEALPDEFTVALKKAIAGELRSDLATRWLYSTDASMYQIQPMGVVFPRDGDDLAAIVEHANAFDIPLLARGSGSSLAGQAVGHGLVIDCSRHLTRIIEFNPEAGTVRVEPGVILSKLNQEVGNSGLEFGPDPASADRATIGGVIGNNASGAHSIRHGVSADHLLEADVLLADGSLATWGAIDPGVRQTEEGAPGTFPAIVRAALDIRQQYAEAIRAGWPTTWRNAAGYRLNYLLPWSPGAPPMWDSQKMISGDYGSTYPPAGAGINLASLLAGSEGTLGIVRAAKLNLVRKPQYTVLAILAYDSIADACDDVPRLLEKRPSAIELIPRQLIQLARSIPAYSRQMGFIDGDPEALLAIEFAGDDLRELKSSLDRLGAVLYKAIDKDEQERIWAVRKAGLGILMSKTGPDKPLAFIEDLAVPVERLGQFVRKMKQLLHAFGTSAAFYAHASAGCLHIRPVLDVRGEEGRRRLRQIAEEALALVIDLGGTSSGEHGDGLARSEWLEKMYGQEVVAAFGELKYAADPRNLFNPGKIVQPEPMDENLRYGDRYQPVAWAPELDFSRGDGLTGAIEQCNGAGVCRKDQGVMCPSYQATREEMHSTRGRANLLRSLISMPAHGIGKTLHDPELETAVRSALELCLACKGCKAECPSGVDMAKLKYEFQAYYYRTHRRPLRDWIFGNIGAIVEKSASAARIFNWMVTSRFFRKIAGNYLGLANKRHLPVIKTISKVGRPNPGADLIPPDGETVVFLPDAFTRYFEPAIEAAALSVLAGCGVQTIVLPVLGAGRTLISKGFLSGARRHAERVMAAIREIDPGGTLPVIGIEPSEIYTLKDEYLDLVPVAKEEVRTLARRTWTIEEFLVRPDKNNRMRIANMSISKEGLSDWCKAVLHSHCYQKAQPLAEDGFPAGQDAVISLLKAVGVEVETIPSGCCGMAGSFGYEAEHYNVSMQIGELVLFPAVRRVVGAGFQAVVVAPGSSCRTQILDGTGVKSLHPLELLEKLMQG